MQGKQRLGLCPTPAGIRDSEVLPSHSSITAAMLEVMDTTITAPRSPAQSAASRTNGSKSTGPITTTGRALASLNGTEHGLAATAVLLPSERVEEYEACIRGWFVTLMPRSPGEGQLAARVGDVGWRMGRLQQLEERLVNAALEKKVAESAPAKALQGAREALQAVQSVAMLAEEVTTPRPSEAVAQLATGLKFVAGMIGAVEIPLVMTAAFEQATTALLAHAYTDVPPEAFRSLGRAARCAETAVKDKIADLEKAVAAEREKLADLVLLGDDADAKLLDRHRSRLSRELGAHLSNLKLLRELAVPARDREEQDPISVELRVLGRGQT